jgi:hypothetical protein
VSSVVVSLLHSLRCVIQSRASLHLENIALRHQLAVVHRHVARAFASRRPIESCRRARAHLARLALGRSRH